MNADRWPDKRWRAYTDGETVFYREFYNAVGHILDRDPYWVALFDGAVLGVTEDYTDALLMVEQAAREWGWAG